ncbi:hypothetical protein [Rhodopirellula islandica]|uniref:hypothetical protein n=1 Tax=Rhodopirellula islandica TaxID=595434 RepID=UPI00064A7BAF|nr:hypothetical protein [Rhodopirellula islandica]
MNIKSVVSVSLVVLSVGCSPNGSSSYRPSGVTRTSHSTAEDTWEYKLALLNKGEYVSPNDPTVRRFRGLLDRIAKKSGLSDKRIAETTYGHHDLVKKAGDSISLLRFMDESCRTYETGEQLGVSYEEILTTVVLMVENG